MFSLGSCAKWYCKKVNCRMPGESPGRNRIRAFALDVSRRSVDVCLPYTCIPEKYHPEQRVRFRVRVGGVYPGESRCPGGRCPRGANAYVLWRCHTLTLLWPLPAQRSQLTCKLRSSLAARSERDHAICKVSSETQNVDTPTQVSGKESCAANARRQRKDGPRVSIAVG